MSKSQYPDEYVGRNFSSAVKNAINLTLKFTNAVASAQTDKQDNTMFSAYNALTCMAMVAAGAEGQTKQELSQTLFGMDAASLDQAVQDLAKLNKDMLAANEGKVTLKTANGIWVNADHAELGQEFKQDMERTFSATIDRRSFGDSNVVSDINQWASDNTNNLVTRIVERLSPSDYAILASALYFKGDWTHQFDKKLTREKAFTFDGGATVLTKMMQKTFKDDQGLRYQEGDDYQAVTLTYGKQDYETGQFPSMRIVLVRPRDEAQSARDWLAAQPGDRMPHWLEPYAFQEAVGAVELPHMDIDQKHDLKPVLENMGVKQAFDQGRANFSRMSGGNADNLFLSEVTQDIVFKTDEIGSEAAAVTKARMTLESFRPVPRAIDIKFDRSYVLALQDIKTGAVLFAGTVNKPNKALKTVAPQP